MNAYRYAGSRYGYQQVRKEADLSQKLFVANGQVLSAI
jgi:hypothetical protein